MIFLAFREGDPSCISSWRYLKHTLSFKVEKILFHMKVLDDLSCSTGCQKVSSLMGHSLGTREGNSVAWTEGYWSHSPRQRKTTQRSVNTIWQETPSYIALCFVLKDTHSYWKTGGEHNIAEGTMPLESYLGWNPDSATY